MQSIIPADIASWNTRIIGDDAKAAKAMHHQNRQQMLWKYSLIMV
jgi:hypothetical protein|tara:strand:+ start:248 stop:382 length:135 start_codon:yes stop_codon:yes gene_type:complete